MGVTPGRQAVFRYVAEAVPGVFPANPALILPSKEVRRVRFFLDKDLKESVDINDNDIEGHFSCKNIYGVEVEFVVYTVARFTDFVTRDAENLPKAYAVEIIPDQDAATVHWFRGTGWRAKSATLKSKVGDEWIATVVLEAGKMSDPVTVDPGVGAGSRQAKNAIVDAMRLFRAAAITKGGAPVATLTDELTLVVNHGTSAHWTTGEADPVAAGAGATKRRFTGTMNFSLDAGGATAWAAVKNQTVGDLVIPFGAAGQPKITIANVVLPKFNFEVTPETDIIYDNEEYRGTTYTEGVV